MFSKSKSSEPLNATGTGDDTTLIAPGTVIQGNIRFTGVMHLEGSVQGNIASENGQLTVAGGDIEGDVQAARILIDGNVRGNVYATEHLELTCEAVIEGNVFYQVIEMAEGAQVNGGLKHYANEMSGQQVLPGQVEVKAPAEAVDG